MPMAEEDVKETQRAHGKQKNRPQMPVANKKWLPSKQLTPNERNKTISKIQTVAYLQAQGGEKQKTKPTKSQQSIIDYCLQQRSG